MDERPDWGRGRIDPLNPFKFRQLRQTVDQTIGHSDMTPLWGSGLRDGRALHWDGLNPSLKEVLVSSAIGNGASTKSVDLESLDRVGEWLRDLEAARLSVSNRSGAGGTRGAGIRSRVLRVPCA